MVEIEWCLKQMKGLELVGPNSNMSDSYVKMAEESLSVIREVDKSDIWKN
jgi:hypothetical protein|tara:strand:- start:1323 stop:1472 length:150 start_codon:yes stop_codon:yes gene_type:complete